MKLLLIVVNNRADGHYLIPGLTFQFAPKMGNKFLILNCAHIFSHCVSQSRAQSLRGWTFMCGTMLMDCSAWASLTQVHFQRGIFSLPTLFTFRGSLVTFPAINQSQGSCWHFWLFSVTRVKAIFKISILRSCWASEPPLVSPYSSLVSCSMKLLIVMDSLCL